MATQQEINKECLEIMSQCSIIEHPWGFDLVRLPGWTAFSFECGGDGYLYRVWFNKLYVSYPQSMTCPNKINRYMKKFVVSFFKLPNDIKIG